MYRLYRQLKLCTLLAPVQIHNAQTNNSTFLAVTAFVIYTWCCHVEILTEYILILCGKTVADSELMVGGSVTPVQGRARSPNL